MEKYPSKVLKEMHIRKYNYTIALLLFSASSLAQMSNRTAIPTVLSGISYKLEDKLVLTKGKEIFVEVEKKDAYPLSKMIGNPIGAETGIMLDLHMPGFNGTVAYGPYVENAEYPSVAFLPKDMKMTDGKALLEFKKVFTKSNDFCRFQDKQKGIIGYRIMDGGGRIIYEGGIAFKGNGPYEALPTIIEGPMINELSGQGCVVSYETQLPLKTTNFYWKKIFF